MIARIHIDRTIPCMASRLRVGVTFTKHTTAEPWIGTEESRARANAHVDAMRSAWFNQHIAGWGIDANKLCPSLDTRDWTEFDRRMQWMVERKLENVVLTCYGAPGWMTIPGLHPRYRMLAPEHAQAYASFCVECIERAIALDVPVKALQYWNELKGYGTHGGDWDIASYTLAYNAWYEAIKSRPELDRILLGGPYIILENETATDGVITFRNLDTLQYWSDRAHGADAVAVVHALSHGGTHEGAGVLSHAEYMQDTGAFGTIARQLHWRFDACEIWFAEYYSHSDTAQYDTLDPQFQAAFIAASLVEAVRGGVSLALSWGLTGDESLAPGGCIASWLTDTRPLSGKGLVTDTGILPGDKTPLYDVYRVFHEYFGPGALIYDAESSDPLIAVLASDRATLLVNKHDSPQVVRWGTTTHRLERYEVCLIPVHAPLSTEEIARRVAQEEMVALAQTVRAKVIADLRGEIVAAVDKFRETLEGGFGR